MHALKLTRWDEEEERRLLLAAFMIDTVERDDEAVKRPGKTKEYKTQQEIDEFMKQFNMNMNKKREEEILAAAAGADAGTCNGAEDGVEAGEKETETGKEKGEGGNVDENVEKKSKTEATVVSSSKKRRAEAGGLGAHSGASSGEGEGEGDRDTEMAEMTNANDAGQDTKRRRSKGDGQSLQSTTKATKATKARSTKAKAKLPMKWTHLSKLVPTKNDMTCRGKWSNLMHVTDASNRGSGLAALHTSIHAPFTPEEDALLQALV